MDISQLPGEILNQLPGDSGAPRVPYNGPLAPAGQQPAPAAPNIVDGERLGVPSKVSGVDLLANTFLQHLLSRVPPPPPQNPTQNGGFADKLSRALNNVGAGQGDAAAATKDLPQGVGALGGIQRTLAARNQRVKQEHDDALRQQQQQEEMKQRSALNAIQMAVHQRALEKYDLDARDKVYSTNEVAAKAREDAGFVVQRGITEPELQAKMQNYKGQDGKHLVDDFDVLPSGQIDVNGQPVKTYTLVQKTAEQVQPTEEERAFIKNNGGPDLPEGTKMGNDQLTAFRLQAQKNATAKHVLEAANQEALTDQQKSVLSADLHTAAVQHALSANPADPIQGVKDGLAAANDHIAHGTALLAAAKQHGDPAAIQEAQQYLTQAQQEQKSLQNVAAYGFSENAVKEHETARHNREEELNKQREIAQKKSGVASPADAALVDQIGTGRSDMPNPRTKEGERIAALVAEKYGDYDVTKGQTWSKSRNEYMGSGQTAKKVVSYNTALEHMKDLYDHSTFEGLYVPGSKDYSDRSVALNYVSHEVGTAIKNGIMSEKEGKEILESLKGWTPGTAKERTAETARLLHDKIDEYQRKFDESKPSSAVQVPILMSPKAGAAYDYIQSGGQIQPQQQQQQPQQQPGQPAQYKVGDTIVQNGRTFRVTSVDANGKVTGAQ